MGDWPKSRTSGLETTDVPVKLRSAVHLAYNPRRSMAENPSVTMPAVVEKIIKPPYVGVPEKAQIAVEGADHLYREIRIENTLTDEEGRKVRLKPGAEVQVTVEAEPEATSPKS
jgi:hypothetical protein